MPAAIDITEIAPEHSFHPRPVGPLGETRSAVQPVPANAIKKFRDGAQSAPKTIRLAAILDARLKVTKPFIVEVDRTGAQVTARAQEIEEFGIGPHTGDALEDLGKTIAELYFTLEQRAEDLGPDLRRVRAVLHQHLHQVHA